VDFLGEFDQRVHRSAFDGLLLDVVDAGLPGPVARLAQHRVERCVAFGAVFLAGQLIGVRAALV